MFLFHYNTATLIFQYLYVFLHKIHKQISTNIKTSLQAATVAVDSIRNISTGAYIGSDGLFDTATLAAYKQQLEGLTVTQQKMALMTTNLTAAQREQVLSYIASTTATKTLTAEQVLSCTADEKRILVKAGLIAEEELEKGAVINLTQEKLKEILADETLNATEKNTILTKFGVTGANLTEASSWEVLGKSIGKATIAMMKWLFLTPAGWATLAIGGVVGLIGAYAKWGPTLENTREKLEDLKSECDTIASDLSSVNSELETTKQRMDELEGKGTLTFTEKEEYDNLVKTNNELQRKIDLLELEQKTKNKEKNKTFVETMEKDVYSTDYYRDGLDDGKIKKGQAGRSEHRTTTTEQAYIIQQFNDREKLLDDLAKAKTETERKRIQEQIDEIDKYLSDRNEQFKSDADGIEYIQNPTTDDEKAVNAWLDYINDFQDRMAIAMGGDNAKTNAFNRIVDNWQFDNTVQGLQDLGKQGKVTAEMLDDPKYDAFIQKLYELGIIDSVDNLDAVALAFNNVGTEAETAGGNVDKMTVSLSEMKSASDSISALSSAFKQLSDDGYLTTESISKIQEATQLSGDEWEEYQNKLIRAKAGSSEFNQVMSELTHKILENKFGTIDLTNATEEEISAIEDKIEATLRENNVANASAIAQEFVAKKKAQVQIQNRIAKDGIDSVIEGLKDETNWCGLTANAYAQLVAKEIIFNNNDLDVSGKLTKLQSLYGMLGLVGDKWERLNNAMSGTSQQRSSANINAGIYKREGANRQYEWVYNGVSYSTEEEAQNAYMIDQINKDITVKNTNPNFTDTDSSKDNTPDYEDSTEAIINRINLRAKELEQQEESIQNAIEIAELENDYEKQISLTNDKLDVQRQKVDALKTANNELHKMAEDLRNSTPDWDEESWFNSQGEETQAYIDFINGRIDAGASKEEIELIKDQFEKISKIKKTWVDNDKEIAELNKEILQDEKEIADIREENYNDILDDIQRHADNVADYYDNINKELDKRITKEEALLQIMQGQTDATSKLMDVQTEIDKAIRDSRISLQYLDEKERESIFNDDDYNKLSKLIKSTQEDIDTLSSQFYDDVIEAYKRDKTYLIESITAEYERQVAMKERELEIAQAQVDLTKKQLQLNNVLAEKNVKQLVERNGQYVWEWVADTDKVRQATEEYLDAEAELKRQEYEKKQQEAIDARQGIIDGIKAQQAANDYRVEKMNEYVDDLGKAIENCTDPVKTFEELAVQLGDASGDIVTAFKNATNSILGSGSVGSSNGGSGGSPTTKPTSNATATIPGLGKVAAHIDSSGKVTTTGLPSGTVVKSNDGKTQITIKNRHADGTRYTPGGWSMLGEENFEAFVDKNGHLIPINQPTIGNIDSGGVVFNMEQMNNLRTLWDWSNINPSNLNSVLTNRAQTGKSEVNSNTFGDIIINAPRDYNDFVKQLTQRIKTKSI